MIEETTALGAAYLAGNHACVYPEPEKLADNWRLERRDPLAQAHRLGPRHEGCAGATRAIRRFAPRSFTRGMRRGRH